MEAYRPNLRGSSQRLSCKVEKGLTETALRGAMTSDHWMILIMGMALACGPVLLVWLEDRTRARGAAVPSLVTIKGYNISPHSAFSLVIAIMLIYLSYLMRGIGLGFVFMVFGFVDVIVAVQNIRKSKKPGS